VFSELSVLQAILSFVPDLRCRNVSFSHNPSAICGETPHHALTQLKRVSATSTLRSYFFQVRSGSE
jgi:hypothetical protein